MTETNLLKNAKAYVHFLGKGLGSHCEVVYQDVKEGCVKAIANGHVSGRSVGAPLTDYALQIIKSEVWRTRDYDTNYVGKTSSDHELRSSTFFIKDASGDALLAMLCINIDKQPYQTLVDTISKLGMLDIAPQRECPPKKLADITLVSPADICHSPAENFIENFSQNISQIITPLLSQVLHLPQDIPLSRLTQEEKMQVTEHLATRGVFKIKGSIAEVAKIFDCSEATVYRYLSKVDSAVNK